MTKIKNKLFTVAVLATSTFAVTALSIGSVLARGGWWYYVSHAVCQSI